MNTRPGATRWLCTGLAPLLLAGSVPALGAGAWLTESGGADTGMAGAGRAALVLDAASQVANPASLARLPRSSVTVAVMPASVDTQFNGSAATAGAAGDLSGAPALGGLYAAQVDERIAFGVAAYSYFGLGFEMGDAWAGSRALDQVSFLTFNIAPAAALRLNDRLSAGAALDLQWARYDFALDVAGDAPWYGPPSGLDDGHIELDDSSLALGGQLGLLYHASERSQIGLSWTAPVRHSFGANVHARGLHPTLQAMLPPDDSLALRTTVPQQLALGVAREMPGGGVVSLGLDWQDWSAMGDTTFRMPQRESDVFPDGLRDTWGASIGVRQPVNERWTLSAGLGYESDPVPTAGVPVYFPVSEQWRVAAGAERSLGNDARLRLMLSLMAEGSAQVLDTPPPLPLPGIPSLSGSWKDSRAVLLGLALDFDL